MENWVNEILILLAACVGIIVLAALLRLYAAHHRKKRHEARMVKIFPERADSPTPCPLSYTNSYTNSYRPDGPISVATYSTPQAPLTGSWETSKGMPLENPPVESAPVVISTPFIVEPIPTTEGQPVEPSPEGAPLTEKDFATGKYAVRIEDAESLKAFLALCALGNLHWNNEVKAEDIGYSLINELPVVIYFSGATEGYLTWSESHTRREKELVSLSRFGITPPPSEECPSPAAPAKLSPKERDAQAFDRVNYLKESPDTVAADLGYSSVKYMKERIKPLYNHHIS